MQMNHDYLLEIEVEVEVNLLEVEEIGLWDGEICTV